MKYLKIFEDYNKIINNSFGLTDTYISDYIDYYQNEYSLDKNDSLLKEIEKTLVDIYKTPFGFNEEGELKGIENFPNEIWLYRIIDNEYDNIDQNCLGRYWTYDEAWLNNQDFQSSVGFNKNKPYYKVSALFKKEDLDTSDFPELLWQLSHERELRLKNKCIKPIKFEITKFK